MEGLVIVKLGGSLITFKDRPITVNLTALRKAIKAMAKAGKKYFIVHGGGSFGHYQAARYGLSSSKAKKEPYGVSETRNAMMELNSWVRHIMLSEGFRPFTIPPQHVFGEWKLIRKLIKLGVHPVSYGDVVLEDGFRIVSGDEIVEEAARRLRPDRVVFVMDVPGILKNVRDQTSTIPFPSKKDEDTLSVMASYDVTGGLLSKLNAAFRMAERGTDVCFVSGYMTDEFIKAILGLKFRGSLVRGVKVGGRR
jgi:isopentenyl phosphate kinase